MLTLASARYVRTVPRVAVRQLSTTTRDAFLEPVNSHPGVTCLSLNRPASKNAISVRLLQVRRRLTPKERYSMILKQLRECLEEAHFDKECVFLSVNITHAS
jgi:methylglutaconyl-CoA hydratase